MNSTVQNKLNNLRSKESRLISESAALIAGGLRTAQSRAENETILAALEETREEIEMIEATVRGLPANAPAPVAAPVPAIITAQTEARDLNEHRTKINQAFRHLLRWGRQDNAPEQRALTTTSDGALVPQGFDSVYADSLKAYGPLATIVKTKRNENGAPWKFTIVDDASSTMNYITEGSAAVEEDPAMHSEIPGTDSLVTMVKYSFNLLDDAFSLESFIRDIAGLRVARAVEYALSTGTDNGTSTTLPNSPTGGLLGNVSAGVTQVALADGITYANLVSLRGSVDYAYQVNGVFMGSPSAFEYLNSQVDSTGRPLYKFNEQTGNLVVAGKDFVINNAMAAYNTASSPVVLFGEFSRAYAYLNGGGLRIKVLSERFADTLEGAAILFHRLGAANLLLGASNSSVKAFVTAAS